MLIQVLQIICARRNVQQLLILLIPSALNSALKCALDGLLTLRRPMQLGRPNKDHQQAWAN